MLIADVFGAYEWHGAPARWLAGLHRSTTPPRRAGALGDAREVRRLRTRGLLTEGRRLYVDVEGRVHRLAGTSEFAERMVISTRQPEAVIR